MAFRTFVENEVLTAALVNDFLMKQANVIVATTAERDAIPAPPNGMQVYVTTSDQLFRRVSSTWRRIGGRAPIGIARRTTAVLNSGNSVYANISATGWSNSELAGGMQYSAGYIVPYAGIYVVEWSMIWSAGTPGLIGIAVNAGATVNGQDLHALGTILSGGVNAGNGSAMLRLAAGDKLTLWCYGSGAAVPLNAIANAAPHWGARWIEE